MKRYAVIAALVALIAFGCSAFAQEKPAEKASPAAPAVNARPAGMREALQLTPDQEAKLQELRKAREGEAKAFADQMKKLRDEMQALRQDPKADPAKTNGLIDQIFKLQAERAKAGLQHQREREKIFTPEQLEKMKKGPMGMMGPGMGARMGMAHGFGMRMGMRPGMMMRGRMGMRPGMGMRMGMRPGMGIRNRVNQAVRRGLRMGMRPGMMMRGRMNDTEKKDVPQPEPKR